MYKKETLIPVAHHTLGMPNDKSADTIAFMNEYTDASSVSDFVSSQNWNEDAGRVERVLLGEPTEEDTQYLESKLGSLGHKKDSRSAIQYAEELLRGWVIEDVLRTELASQGLPVELSGEDKEREFLEETTADADLVLQNDGNTTHIEVVSDYTGFWKRTGNADLRDNKFNQIKSHDETLLLGIDFDSNTVFVVDPETVPSDYMQSHPYWNKPAYRLDVSATPFVELPELPNQISELL